MPDTMFGFGAQENDLEQIDFFAGELERIEDMLPVHTPSRKLSRQNVLRHCLVATADRYCEGLDSKASDGPGERQSPEPASCFGDTVGTCWQGEGAYSLLKHTPDGRFHASATWLFEKQELADGMFVRYFAPEGNERLNDKPGSKSVVPPE